MPSAPHMPALFSQGAPKWEGEIDKLGDFIWHLERQFEVSSITDGPNKLKWILSYVNKSVRDEWISFKEYEDKNWEEFMKWLKEEYPELVIEEKGSVAKLKAICRRFRHIGLLDQEDFSSFCRQFQSQANKCLALPSIISNRELVEEFVNTLTPAFSEALTVRLSVRGTPQAEQGQG
jgi:hypothetical protein